MAAASEEELRAACEELDRRLRAGEPARAEEYLDRLPGLSPESALELIYTEYVALEDLGRPPAPAAWAERFPEYGGRLRRPLAVHAALRRPPSADTLVGPDTGPAGPTAPQVVAGYELLGELGRGGMGVVYEARHVALGRTVALKMILAGELSGPAERARFASEAQTV